MSRHLCIKSHLTTQTLCCSWIAVVLFPVESHHTSGLQHKHQRTGTKAASFPKFKRRVLEPRPYDLTPGQAFLSSPCGVGWGVGVRQHVPMAALG